MSDGVELGIDFKAQADSLQALSKSFEKTMRVAQMSAAKQGFLAGLSDTQIKSKFTELGNTFAGQMQDAGTTALTKLNAIERKLQSELSSAVSEDAKKAVREKYALEVEELNRSFKYQQQAMESNIKTEFKLRSKEYEKLD